MNLRHVLDIPASQITDESVWLQRRRIIAGLAALPALSLAGCSKTEPPPPPGPASPPSGSSTDTGFSTSEELTRWEDATTFNNFYEFGTGKADPSRAARTLRTSPWQVEVSGACGRPGTFDLDGLLQGLLPEERIYRLRCVEGWSMVIPWLGVPLASVLRRFAPTSNARYVAFTTLADEAQMPGIQRRTLRWPYREGLRIDEAMHPLTFLATGMYGQALPQQNGAPLRLVVPWKYGFKSIKSIVEIRFTEEMPDTSWNRMQPREYGFFANVNPQVDHPRWSQATERRIAGSTSRLIANRIETRLFNGYAEQVASMYSGMDLARWY